MIGKGVKRKDDAANASDASNAWVRIMLWDLMRFEVCKSFLKFLRTRWTRWTQPPVAGPFAAKPGDNTRSHFQIFTANIIEHWNINKSSNGITMYVTCEDHVCEYFSSILLKIFQDAQCVKSRERHQHWEGWTVDIRETSNYFAHSFPYILIYCDCMEVAVRPFFFLKS